MHCQLNVKFYNVFCIKILLAVPNILWILFGFRTVDVRVRDRDSHSGVAQDPLFAWYDVASQCNRYPIFRTDLFPASEAPKFTNKTASFNNTFYKYFSVLSNYFLLLDTCITISFIRRESIKPINSYSISVSLVTVLVQAAKKGLMSGRPAVWQHIDPLSKKYLNPHNFEGTSPHSQTDLMSIYLSETVRNVPGWALRALFVPSGWR